ncbi:MAG: diguanylate cyclase [Oscillospiraceae bacterium]
MCRFIKKYKNLLLTILIVYCIVLSVGIIATAIPYNNTYEKYNDEIINFDDYWQVYVDGKKEVDSATLPYKIADENCKVIDIYNTLPKTPFRASVLAFSVYQKNIVVYVDSDVIFKSKFEPSGANSQTPGSGKFHIYLPENFQGKTIHIRYDRVVPEDNGPIANIDIINGVGNPQLFIQNENVMFFIVTIIFALGIILLVTSLIFRSLSIKISPLISLALFAISSSVWIMSNTKIIQFFTSNFVLIHDLEYISFYLMPITLWAFMWQNWKCYSKFSIAMLSIGSAFFAGSLTLKFFGICDFFYLLKMFHILVFVNVIVFAVVAIKVFRRKDFSIKLFYIGYTSLCIGGIIDIIRYYTIFSSQSRASFYILGILLMGIFIMISFIYSTKDKFKERIESDMYKTLAYTDALTKTNNRLKFEQDLDNIQEKIDTYDNIILIMFDVNNFKGINDNYGHLKGDEMLKIIADELITIFKGMAKCYRIGGDEFCLIVTNTHIKVVTTLLGVLNENLNSIIFDVPISVSYGLTEYDKSIHYGLQDVFKSSDDNMYENKRRLKITTINV